MAEASDNKTNSPKKLKLDNNSSVNHDSIHDSITDLANFKSDTILNNNASRKSICLKGTFAGKDGVGIVLLEKTEFTENVFKNDSKYFSKECYLEKDFSNDIYGNYKFFPTAELNGE